MRRTTRLAVVSFALLFALAVSIHGQVPSRSAAVGSRAGASQGEGQQQPPPQGQQPPATGAQGQQQPPATAQQGQQQQQPPQQPTFKAGINFVRVDVIVNDKQGNPVGDLKPGDFEVYEDRQPQKIETFKFVNLGSVTEQEIKAASEAPPREIRNEVDEELEAARDDVRIFAIFLDDYHVRLGNSMAVRAPLEKFLETQLGPNDLVTVMYPLTPTSDLLLTRDHDAVARAVEKFEGRKYDYRPRNMIEEQYQNYPAATVEQIRNQVSLSALKALTTHLGGLREGRKAIILVSEGYTNILPPQLRDPVASMPGMGNPARNDPTAGEDPRLQSANFFATADMQNDLKNVFDAANHNNTSIYTLDPRGLATNEFDVSQPTISANTDREVLQTTQDTLHVLADNTDGRAIVNRNDMSAGLRQVVRDSSAYYLIGYSSSEPPSDGKFHEIRVRVKRPGVQVRARKGYWAPTAEERAKALAPPTPGPPPAITKALSSIVEQQRGRSIRTWIGTSRGDNGKTRVTFVWEPVPPPPGSGPAPRPTRVMLTAAGADGRAYFRGPVDERPMAGTAPPPDGAAPAATVAAAKPSAGSAGTDQPAGRAVFDVPPGKLQLRIAVQGSGAQVLDTDMREVDVPDLTRAEVRLTTPAVLTARTAREFRAIEADPEAVPTPDRQFSRTERLLIRFDAFGPAYTVPTVTARLLNRAGQEMAALTAKPGEKYPEEHSIDLPLAGLAAGEYLVEIKAKGPAGEATELVAIRVTS